MIFCSKESKDIIGTIFLALSIIMLGYMLVSPFNHMIIHVDEYFTLTVLNLPLADLIHVTASDVHPPFHYLLLKLVTEIFSALGIAFDRLFIYKLVSIIPYVIILILSVTKIKKDHGYLTAGLFSFSMVVMSEFFAHYLMVRMYSWAILFVILSFIYLNDVIKTNNIKSWALLTIFSVLGAYTHYFAAIPVICIYLCLFVYLFKYDKQKLKYWFISTICGILLFSPWIFSLMGQIAHVNEDFWIPEITLKRMIGFLGFFVGSGNVYLSIFSIVVFIAVLVNSLREPNGIDGTDKFYILCGIMAYVGTIVIGTILSFIIKPVLVDRYLLPSAAILWFTISFMISKINVDKKFLISFALVLILLIAGIGHMISSNHYWATNNMNKEAFFNQVSQDNNSIVINTAYSYRMFYLDYSNCTEMYLVNHPELYGFNVSDLHDTFDFKETSKKDVYKIVEKNPDKNIYIISKGRYSSDHFKTDTIIKSGSVQFSKVVH